MKPIKAWMLVFGNGRPDFGGEPRLRMEFFKTKRRAEYWAYDEKSYAVRVTITPYAPKKRKKQRAGK